MTGFDAFLWEFIGTALLLLLGNGVCALVNLRTSGARGSDWIVIALGWGMAVFVGASVADPTGGHLNPAVTVMLAVNGSLEWSLVPYYFLGQILALSSVPSWHGLPSSSFSTPIITTTPETSPAPIRTPMVSSLPSRHILRTAGMR